MNLMKDEELLFLIGKGDVDATKQLYQRYAGKLFGYLLKMLKERAIAEDVLHDLFETVITKSYQFEPTYSVSTWLFTIASNKAKNKLTYQQRFKEFDTEQVIELTEEFTESIPLDEAVNLLDEKHRNVINLKYKQGFLISEIAQILSISEGTVKSRLFTAHKKLNALLQYHGK